jgi:hypothetical protein
MSRMVGRAAAMAAVWVLAACAGPEIPFDRASAPEIKTIGVLTPDIPERPTVRLASDVGQSFGLVGGLIDAAMESKRNDRFGAVLIEHNFSVGSTLSQDLVASLKAHGYGAKQVPVYRSKSGFLKSYPTAAETGVDAFLDVSAVGIGYGYVAAGIGSSQPYRPFVWLDCKLVRASDASVLMQDRVMYNPVGEGPKQITISPDPTYQFADFDTLIAGQEQAYADLQAALRQTANQMGTLVR